MKFNIEELNLLLDGLSDTKIRIGKGEVKESYDYIQKILILKKRIERELTTSFHGDKNNG